MQVILQTVCCALCLVPLLLLCVAEDCRRVYTQSGPDCGTVTDTDGCLPEDNDLSDFPIPDPFYDPGQNEFICYRTCYVNGENGQCRFSPSDTFTNGGGLNPQPIFVASTASFYVGRKFSSPEYRKGNNIGNYRKSTICRYNITCDDDKVLAFDILNQDLQERVSCDMPNVCVDKLRIMVPDVDTCETCGDGSDSNCPDVIMPGRTIMIEYISNRETDLSGFEVVANCVDPESSQNQNQKRQADPTECTSPTGVDATPFERADRIQAVLERDPNAPIEVIELDETVEYIDRTLNVSRGNETISFNDIESLEVESLFSIRRYFRIAPGRFSGFAQLAISDNMAVLVQLGINPVFQPSEQELTVIRILDAAIADALASEGQFDVLDGLDLQEQAEDFSVIAEPEDESSESLRKKRGIEPAFVNELALEYGNACNPFLRASACIYQEVILGRDCTEV